MRKSIVALVAGVAVSGAFAADVKWTGEAQDNAWATADNWEGKAVPGAEDTAVFELTENLSLTFPGNDTTQIKNITVSGAGKKLYFQQNFDGGYSSLKFAGPTSVVEVADGAMLLCSNMIQAASAGVTVLEKKGAGEWWMYGRVGVTKGAGKARFANLDVREGLLGKSIISTKLIKSAYSNGILSDWISIRSGATLQVYSYNNFSESGSVRIDASGTLDLAGTSGSQSIDGITGEGLVKGTQSLTLKLAKDVDYTFSGTTGIAKNQEITLAADGTTSWRIASAEALAGARIAGQLSLLSFARGIDTFTLWRPRATSAAGALPTTNEDGDPITIKAKGYSTPYIGYVAGGGRLQAVDSTLTVTGGVLAVTAETIDVSVLNDATLTLGDGTTAENDPDLSRVSALDVQTGGTLVFDSVDIQTISQPIHLAGAVKAIGPAKLTGVTTVDGGYISKGTDTLAYDGGLLLFPMSDRPDGRDFSTGVPTVTVGANGMTVRGEIEQTLMLHTYRVINWYPAFDLQGTLTLEYPGNLTLKTPMTGNGAVRLMDGLCYLPDDAFDDSCTTPFGTGDFTLGNAKLELDGSPVKTLNIATGTGSTFSFGRAANLNLSLQGSTPQHTITLGPIARLGKGSVMAISVDNAANLQVDGTHGKVFSTADVPCYANGLVKAPILASSRRGTQSNTFRFEFMKYDAENGFVNCTNLYTAGLGESGAANIIANCDAATANYTVSADHAVLALRVKGSGTKSSPLTINSGVTLTVGPNDASGQACVIVDSAGDYGGAFIKGGGTLNFGASEGIFVMNTASVDSYLSRIEPVVAGTGGVTYSALPCMFFHGSGTGASTLSRPPTVRVLNTNTYTGGTWINSVQVRPEANGAFGAGTVDVGAGYAAGGQVRFNKAFSKSVLTIPNKFVIRGNGVTQQESGADVYDYGALWFTKSAKLTGEVEIDREARVSTATVTDANIRGELAGVVSGGKLKLRDGGAGTIALTGHNTYTGGTEVVSSTLALAEADSLGTGAVTADAGSVLAFENAADITVANRMNVSGTIKLAGAGNVVFTNPGDMSSGTFDANGHTLPIASLPPVGVCANSADTVATIVLAAGANALPCGLAGDFFLRVDQDATLDLGGRTVTVKKIVARAVWRS